MMVSGGITKDLLSSSKAHPCAICGWRIKANSVMCVICG